MAKALRLEYIDVEQLAENPANWRVHSSEQLDALKGVMDDVGWAGAMLYNERTERLIDGHARKSICKGPVPVLIGDWSEEEERKILATLDPLAAMAEANTDALGKLLSGMQTENEGLQAMLDDLAKQNGIDLFADVAEDLTDPEPQIDRAAELQKEWGTESGQLWVIPGKAGEHRLLCGDSTKAEEVARVMGGHSAAMCITSPPYNVAAKSSLPNKEKYIAGGDARTSEDYLTLLTSFMDQAVRVCEFVWVNVQSVAGNKIALIEFMHQYRSRYADTVVWDKLTAEPAMAHCVLNSRFEYVHGFSSKANRAVGTKDFRGTLDNVLALSSKND